MNHKFKRGDRVIYRSSERAGRRDMDGYAGTVLRVDGTAAPYMVKFDKPIAEPMEGKSGWHCREEHLTAEDEEEEQGSMGKLRFTTEMDHTLKRMREEGRTAAEIADVLGLTEQQIYSRISYIEKKKAAVRKEGKPELNPLEEALKEQIIEAEAEKEKLQARVNELEQAYADAATEKHALKAQCDTLAEQNQKLRNALTATEQELMAELNKEKVPEPAEAANVTREGVLNAAIACVCGDRDEQYGSPEDSFGAIAELWNVYLRTIRPSVGYDFLAASDVGVMMALFKIARIAGGYFKSDSFIDACGYLACAAEILDSYK